MTKRNTIEYICEISDRVYLEDDKLHFNIRPFHSIKLVDIKNVVIMPSIFASRDLTFWYSENNLIFFLGFETKKDDGNMLTMELNCENR